MNKNSINLFSNDGSEPKPFLKWAGGKRQLISSIEAVLPKGIENVKNLTYVEPFIGSGAILFWFLRKYKNVKKAIINDINLDLTNAYFTIKNEPNKLIEELLIIQTKYYQLDSEEDKKLFFIDKRLEFNARNTNVIQNTVLLIFLNRTCFNGLYRVNSKNQFNVPFGKHSNPKICDPETIIADSKILQNVEILNGDYTKTLEHADKNSFFYFDPPYKPLSQTSSFNSYAIDVFDDLEQRRLKEFCDRLSSSGYKWLVSNSDPKNTDPNDTFFDDLYNSKNITIDRVKAKRSINSKGSSRGEINELLIYNY